MPRRSKRGLEGHPRPARITDCLVSPRNQRFGAERQTPDPPCHCYVRSHDHVGALGNRLCGFVTSAFLTAEALARLAARLWDEPWLE
jgi:hypothetical protein